MSRIGLPNGKSISAYGLAGRTVDFSSEDVNAQEDGAIIVLIFNDAITNGIKVTVYGETTPKFIKLLTGWNFLLLKSIHSDPSNDVTEATVTEVL